MAAPAKNTQNMFGHSLHVATRLIIGRRDASPMNRCGQPFTSHLNKMLIIRSEIRRVFFFAADHQSAASREARRPDGVAHWPLEAHLIEASTPVT